ncbi:RNA-directed DNA polymerase, eukaryota [Tanacetum coccineum]
MNNPNSYHGLINQQSESDDQWIMVKEIGSTNPCLIRDAFLTILIKGNSNLQDSQVMLLSNLPIRIPLIALIEKHLKDSLGRNGTFTVKDARYRIDQNILPTLAHTTTWDKSIPRKVNVFMWRLSLDRLPHRLNLSSRGMDIPAISCPSCNANVESANHVFFECDIATDMWKLVFRWCDIPLFQASSWDSFNDWIISWHASKEKKHRFYVITTSVLWWLWRYRNSVTFSSQPLRKSDLFDNVRFSSFSWLHNRDHMKLSWNDWLMYPLSITRNGNG